MCKNSCVQFLSFAFYFCLSLIEKNQKNGQKGVLIALFCLFLMSFSCQNQMIKRGKNHFTSISTEPKVRDSSSLGRATKTARTFVRAVFVVCQKQARVGCRKESKEKRKRERQAIRARSTLRRKRRKTPQGACSVSKAGSSG